MGIYCANVIQVLNKWRASKAKVCLGKDYRLDSQAPLNSDLRRVASCSSLTFDCKNCCKSSQNAAWPSTPSPDGACSGVARTSSIFTSSAPPSAGLVGVSVGFVVALISSGDSAVAPPRIITPNSACPPPLNRPLSPARTSASVFPCTGFLFHRILILSSGTVPSPLPVGLIRACTASFRSWIVVVETDILSSVTSRTGLRAALRWIVTALEEPGASVVLTRLGRRGCESSSFGRTYCEWVDTVSDILSHS